jgi:SagB-type dehydrogenase family enzyme
MIMKKLFTLILILASVTIQAQNITLPAPAKKGGSSTIESLWKRHSVRSFQQKDLPMQTLSNLLWATTGLNRKDGKRTNPTAMNKQEISVYAFMKKGVYLYDHKNHTLILKKEGDHRNLVAHGQNFVNDAPVSLVVVGDLSLFPNSSNSDVMTTVGIDAGIACENINIFCASVGLATVPRITMDKAGIKKLLNLSEKQIPFINNPVGFEK